MIGGRFGKRGPTGQLQLVYCNHLLRANILYQDVTNTPLYGQHKRFSTAARSILKYQQIPKFATHFTVNGIGNHKADLIVVEGLPILFIVVLNSSAHCSSAFAF